MVIWGKKKKKKDRDSILTDYGKRRLLTYAESFQELADSLTITYEQDGKDRQQIWDCQRLLEKQQVICKNMTEVSKILAGMATEVFRANSLPEKPAQKIIRLLKPDINLLTKTLLQPAHKPVDILQLAVCAIM